MQQGSSSIFHYHQGWNINISSTTTSAHWLVLLPLFCCCFKDERSNFHCIRLWKECKSWESSPLWCQIGWGSLQFMIYGGNINDMRCIQLFSVGIVTIKCKTAKLSAASTRPKLHNSSHDGRKDPWPSLTKQPKLIKYDSGGPQVWFCLWMLCFLMFCHRNQFPVGKRSDRWVAGRLQQRWVLQAVWIPQSRGHAQEQHVQVRCFMWYNGLKVEIQIWDEVYVSWLLGVSSQMYLQSL